MDSRSCLFAAFAELKGANDFDKYFTSGAEQARVGMDKLFDAVISSTYSDYYINSTDSALFDGGTYYSLRHNMWFSGNYFEGGADAPLRGFIDMRYCGPTGYLMCVLTVADEDAINRYLEVALNIADAIPFGGTWSTAVAAAAPGSAGGSDPGDYYAEGRGDYVEEDGWGDYFPDDEYYESNDAGWDEYDDYDIYSDPGDGNDEWSDPGDYYDDGYYYDEWSDPGDYYDY